MDPDAHLDASRRGQGRALQRLLEDHLYFVLLHSRWIEDGGWAIMRRALEPAIPAVVRWLVAPLLRRRIRGQLHAQGLGRHSSEEIYHLGCADLDALGEVLGDQTYLLGEEISTVDLIAFGTLIGVLWTPFDNPLVRHGRARPELVRYCERIWRRFYPDTELPPHARS